MTAASFHEPREVLGIDGHISVVGPDDVLVVRIARTLTREEASGVLEQVRRVLGRDRCLIFDELAEISVMRDANTPKVPDVDSGADGNNNQAKDKQ